MRGLRVVLLVGLGVFVIAILASEFSAALKAVGIVLLVLAVVLRWSA